MEVKMANRRTSLKKVRKLLKHKLEGVLGSRRLAALTSLSHTQVIIFLKRFDESDYSCQELSEFDDQALGKTVYPDENQPAFKKPMPDFEKLDKELCRGKKNGVTRTLLWQEYIAENPGGYRLSQFNEHYRRYRKEHKKSRMAQERVPGERMSVDYSGLKMSFITPETGELHECELFVTSLGVSGKIYAEATLTQQVPDWIASNENAFHYYGGVPALLIPDNLKSAITKPDRYDPVSNPVFEEFSEFYGAAIFAARSRKPRDKPLAENSVQNVQRWIVAPLRKWIFFSLAELNEAIREKLELLNNRGFSVREGSRSSQFEEEDLPELRPLPKGRFEYADWCKAKVHPDYHIQYHYCYYSVHHSCIGKTVDVRATASGVEMFCKGKRIASHMRLRGRGKRSTVDEHMPPHHLAYKKLPANARKWLETRSGNTLLLARRIFSREKHAACSLRHLSGVMSLERKYGIEALEEASGYVLHHETSYRYRTLANALKHELYKEPELFQQDIDEHVIEHANIRGADYYKGGN